MTKIAAKKVPVRLKFTDSERVVKIKRPLPGVIKHGDAYLTYASQKGSERDETLEYTYQQAVFLDLT